ncbi:hemerythrin domain-containing protein [Rhizobacter sp. P5_C2]
MSALAVDPQSLSTILPAPRPRLAWSDGLALGLEAMDHTHQEFVDLLAQVATADDDTVLPAWAALVEHTQAHVDQEDRWMRDTGFASGNCHATQHRVVLEVMREGVARGQVAMIRQMADELAAWFPTHAQTMDAALALHLRGVGYDAASGEVHLPQALPAAAITGCGSSSCG